MLLLTLFPPGLQYMGTCSPNSTGPSGKVRAYFISPYQSSALISTSTYSYPQLCILSRALSLLACQSTLRVSAGIVPAYRHKMKIKTEEGKTHEQRIKTERGEEPRRKTRGDQEGGDEPGRRG